MKANCNEERGVGVEGGAETLERRDGVVSGLAVRQRMLLLDVCRNGHPRFVVVAAVGLAAPVAQVGGVEIRLGPAERARAEAGVVAAAPFAGVGAAGVPGVLRNRISLLDLRKAERETDAPKAPKTGADEDKGEGAVCD